MEFHGFLPLDAPDPSIASEARLRAVPFPVFELCPQPALTRAPVTGFSDTIGTGDVSSMSVSFSYTLWRYPDDHADPRNELEQDERTRRSLDEEPPWGRPEWLRQQAKLLHYPMLWDAVQTTWHATPDPTRQSLPQLLVDHVNQILRNRFREELGLPPGPGGDSAWMAPVSAVAPTEVTVDGRQRSAVHLDTDPFVFAVGFRVDRHVTCTVVIPRDDLPLIELALRRFSSAA
ncbi:hypothetical protein [Microbacterium resistens]|uniref:hypothetical protein n=1 Tax=Microbacterium resistens TaxID=156977 RepID=UPI0022F0EE11|nr:hypothetical protein [Streptomyces sp. MS2A]